MDYRDRPQLQLKHIAIGIIGIVAVSTLIGSFKIIKTSQVGIKSRFGLVSNNILEEGFHFKIPFVDSIEKISLKQHQENFTIENTQTKDLQPVSVSYKVIYSIPASKVIYNKKSLNGDIFEVLIKPRANETIMNVLATYPAEDLINNRDAVISMVKKKLAERVTEHANIDDISITDYQFQDTSFTAAVQNKVVAKQNAQSAEIKKQQAQAEADQILIKAKADAESIKIKANALSNNPKLVDLTIAENWDGTAPTTVVITGGNPSNLILPIKSN